MLPNGIHPRDHEMSMSRNLVLQRCRRRWQRTSVLLSAMQTSELKPEVTARAPIRSATLSMGKTGAIESEIVNVNADGNQSILTPTPGTTIQITRHLSSPCITRMTIEMGAWKSMIAPVLGRMALGIGPRRLARKIPTKIDRVDGVNGCYIDEYFI
ncbi:hypothetical protein BDW74DRAFT_172607 [Aspergillus multicolor]|uniref:uncharacterized protein n=1 Tax=Aspergillus multicolor TaxID=41759 RepID=UPI003CCD64E4